METARTTPKDFFLWAGAMLGLYWSVSSFIGLLFDYISHAFPNPLQSQYYSDPYASGISFEMASLLVLFPIFLVLMRLINQGIIADPSKRDIWVRRWAIVLTLFVAGVSIAVDLVVLLNEFFQGNELTAAFLLKVAIVLLVAGAVFMHFIADLWGYWAQFPQRAHSVGWAAGALVLVTIAAGFLIVGTPSQARQYREDQNKISDLETIQSETVMYWQQKQKLPASLGDLNDPISGFTVPTDQNTKLAYEYLPGKVSTSSPSFSLCATFNRESPTGSGARFAAPTDPSVAYSRVSDNWQHTAGRVCFTRTIDTQLHPPTKQVQ